MRVLCDCCFPHPPVLHGRLPISHAREVPQGNAKKRAWCHFVGCLFLTLFVCLTRVKTTDEFLLI